MVTDDLGHARFSSPARSELRKGPYRILRVLGTVDRVVTCLARDPRSQELIVLKVIPLGPQRGGEP